MAYTPRVRATNERCLTCHRVFPRVTWWQAYCSTRCQNAAAVKAYHARQRAAGERTRAHTGLLPGAGITPDAHAKGQTIAAGLARILAKEEESKS